MQEFIKGMDISTLLEEEAFGAKFYDGGEAEDLFTILKRNGVNSIRLRIWNDPYDEDGNPYGAGTCDYEKTKILARRAIEAGMDYYLDFHYSDFWVDPGKQYIPKAWSNYSESELPDAVYKYTKEVLTKLKLEKLSPAMVSVGNEITNGCLWPYGARYYNKGINGDEFFNRLLTKILNAGIRAVRETIPDAKVMLHLDNGGKNELYQSWFDGYIRTGGADFDVIGLSYYPLWHGNFAALANNLNDIAIRYNKDLIIAEVSYPYTLEDYAEYEGLSPDERKGSPMKPELLKGLEYPTTVDGQVSFMQQLNQVLSQVPCHRGKGYYYWEPAWIPVKGCGWATEASLKYINDKGPCGNEWANQCLFDFGGHALPALKV